jgi:hypothetical protein
VRHHKKEEEHLFRVQLRFCVIGVLMVVGACGAPPDSLAHLSAGEEIPQPDEIPPTTDGVEVEDGGVPEVDADPDNMPPSEDESTSAAATNAPVRDAGVELTVGPGSKYGTIQSAVNDAQLGDTVTVRAGTYRERVIVPRGGTGETRRIVIRAAANEVVKVKASERFKSWTRHSGNAYKLVLSNTVFKDGDGEVWNDLNPYAVDDDNAQIAPKDYTMGNVFIDEETTLREVSHSSANPIQEVISKENCWYSTVDDKVTTIYANFGGKDPNVENVEVALREFAFAPATITLNYITIEGFDIMHAANGDPGGYPWTQPVRDLGAISTRGGSYWTIRKNKIHNVKSVGIAIGGARVTFTDGSGYSASGGNSVMVKIVENEIYKVQHTSIYNKSSSGLLVQGNHVHHHRTRPGADHAALSMGGFRSTQYLPTTFFKKTMAGIPISAGRAFASREIFLFAPARLFTRSQRG